MNSKWQEILDDVTTLRREAAKLGVKLWYRGQRLAKWPIRSTLHRRVIEYFERTGVHFGDEDVSFLREEYKTVYRMFKAQAWHLLDPIERADWGIIFRMQHHGFPTRLIDWTKSFACAIYFAQWQRNPNEDAAIYVLNPEGLNLVSAGRQGLIAVDDQSTGGNFDTRPYHPRYLASTTDLPTIAVAPFSSNARMVAQSSAFTLSGDSFLPLENQFAGQLVTKGYLRQIILPIEIRQDVDDFLETVGLGHFEYFPDLEGLRSAYRAEMDKTIERALEVLASQKRQTKGTE
jgi:FRG domain